MPYIDQGTLGQWLSSNPKPWEVQFVFRQLVQVRSHLCLKERAHTIFNATTFFFSPFHPGIGVHA